MRAPSESLAQVDSKPVEIERRFRTLGALRDTLLPKLISGELRVDRPKKPARDDGHREPLRDARTQS